MADEDAAAEQPGGALLVAELEGKVVGFLALSMNRGAPFVRAELRAHGHVLELIVSEDQRGKGIGQALLSKAEEITKAAGYRALLVGLVEENTAARNAYTKFGFRPLTREMIKRLDRD
ncbi:MAG: GNAT family N-acetyltransferase [Rhabdaerophilum sp.]